MQKVKNPIVSLKVHHVSKTLTDKNFRLKAINVAAALALAALCSTSFGATGNDAISDGQTTKPDQGVANSKVHPAPLSEAQKQAIRNAAEVLNEVNKLSLPDQRIALDLMASGAIKTKVQIAGAMAANRQAVDNAIKALPKEKQAIALKLRTGGVIRTAAQIPDALANFRAENPTKDIENLRKRVYEGKLKARRLHGAVNALSPEDKVIILAAIEDGRIDDVSQISPELAKERRLRVAKAYDRLPASVRTKLQSQYQAGRYETVDQLNDAARQIETQILDQDHRAAMALPQMAYAAEQNAVRLQQGMRDRLNGDAAFMQASGDASRTANAKKNVWAQVSGEQSHASGSAGIPGFSMRGAGVTVGADTAFDNSRLGIALGYANSTIDASGQHAKSKVDTFSVGLYGSHSINNWFANAGVSYSGHSIKSDRNAMVDGTNYGMSAKTHGNTIGGFVELGKRIETSVINITPSLTASVNRTSIKGFTETGGASVTADKSRYLSARVGFGVRLWKDFGDEGHRITPSLRLTYEREVGDSAASMGAVLHGVGGLAPMRTMLMGQKLGRDILSAQAGVTMQLSKRLCANAAIDTSWRKHETQVGATGSLVYRW